MSIEQLELFAPEPPAQRHSDTSVQAARDIEALASRLRREVHDFLVARGEAGATDEEMQACLGMAANTQRPRRVELCRAGLVVDSGRRRLTRARRLAVAWVARAASGGLP